MIAPTPRLGAVSTYKPEDMSDGYLRAAIAATHDWIEQHAPFQSPVVTTAIGEDLQELYDEEVFRARARRRTHPQDRRQTWC